MRPSFIAALCFTLIFANGCQEEIQQPPEPILEATQKNIAEADQVETSLEQATPAATEQVQTEQPQQEPPSPPIFEDFQGEPQLTLFPRAGSFRPEDNNDQLPYWNTFIEHLVRVTSVVEEQSTGSRGWVFRGINTIDSVGFFSPLGVDPETEYQVSFKLTTDLTEGASAGVGILEFNEFLWIPTQYTEELFKQHFRGSHEGKRVTGATQGEHTFTFTTGPETHMIHIVLFREGAHDRNSLMFDDIRIEKAE